MPVFYWLPLGRPFCSLLLFTAITLVGPNARGAPPAADHSLTLSEAVQQAMQFSPLLPIAREDVETADARLRQSDQTPPFELAVELENFAGTGEFDAIEATETTLQLSRALELGGKRAHRKAVAHALKNMALADLDVLRLDIATETALRFVEVLAAQEQLNVAHRFLSLAEQIRDHAERRVRAGAALSAELYRAQAEVSREALFVRRANDDLDLARRELAATWGSSQTELLSAEGNLYEAPALEPLQSLLARLDQNPRTLRRVSEQRLREAESRLTQTRDKPDLTLSVGVRHLAEPDEAALVASMSVPLGTRLRNRPYVDESASLLRQVQARNAAEQLELTKKVTSLHRQAELARESLGVFREEIQPATTTALSQVARGYRAGRLPYTELAHATRDAMQTELELLRIAANYHQLIIELERLTGTTVATSGQSL